MANDDRSLRDQLERLQTQTKALRAQLDDPGRLDAVRDELEAERSRLKKEHAAALAQLTQLQASAEDARMRSMQAKRERAEGDLAGHLEVTVRVTFGIAAMLGAALAGVHFGELMRLGLPGMLAFGAGGLGVVGMMYRIGRDLRG